jgi:signal transduction histidine kinase
MKAAIFFVLLFYTGLCAHCQTITWTKGSTARTITPQLLAWEDTARIHTISQVTVTPIRHQFRTLGLSTLHFGFTDRIYWLRFKLDNQTSDSLVLRFEQAFLSLITLYYADSTDHWHTIVSGYKIPLSRKPIVDHFQVFSIPSGQSTFYVRIKPMIHAIPVQLMEKNAWAVQASREKMTYGIYAGILLFAVIINLFLFLALKKSYFLNYAVLVFFYLLTSALVMEGYAVYFFPTIDLMFWYKLVPVLDMAALLFYCISFFELRKYFPNLYHFTLASAVFCCFYLLLFFWLPLLPVLLLNQVFALLVFVLASYVGIRAGRNGNRLGYIFSVSYFFWFLLILIEATYIQTGYPPHFTTLSYVSTAIFIEAFLLAFIQAKRFQWERKEDHMKQFEMRTRIERMEERFQREILNTKLEIQEQTFNTVSEEIHDNVGQLLSLAKIQVNILEQQPNKDASTLQELKENISLVMSDLRHIAKNLSSYYISNNSLEETVGNQIQRINRLGVIHITLDRLGREQPLNNQKKLVLYRIIQESLQNIIKHAKATNVQLKFNYGPTALQISISDNGKGFNKEHLCKESGGLGLQNMLGRASLIGATTTIDTELNHGTTIQITTPYA